jgi:N-acetylmuramoyl-L-alanine amidase
MKVQESREVAHSIQERLYRNMRRLNDEVSDWGAKSGDFMVLLGVEAPSVLVEIGSIRNSAQERMLSTVEYREQLAHFLEEALVDYLSNHVNENEETHHASQEDEAGL